MLYGMPDSSGRGGGDRVTEHPRDDLAAYALGALDARERREVADHVAGCPACREELAPYEAAAWGLAETAAAAPPARLRGKIIDRARSGRSWRGWLAPLRRPVPLGVPLALAVALVVAVVSYAGARGDADAYGQAVSAVADGRLVTLAETGEAGGARGTLVIPPAGAAYLILHLPPLPAGHSWEAWVIRADRPLAAGVSEVRSAVLTLRMTERPAPGDQVAVTLEQAGGASQPTSRPVLTARV